MPEKMRRESRRIARAIYSICWQDQDGLTKSAQAEGLDASNGGISFKSSLELPLGIILFIQGPDGRPTGHGVVRRCTAHNASYVIGLELDEEAKKTMTPPAGSVADYYELLQISPQAENATVHRVYRFLAARYHPDNPETGDPEKFLQVQNAFETLADPERRAIYDSTRESQEAQLVPMSASIDFMDGIGGEVNRRLALLSLLYKQRRMNSQAPEVSLAEVEMRMGFPRDYLDFTMWYLKSKKYITVGDNSDLVLTALGVDYVEENSAGIPLLSRLLNSGTEAATSSGAATGREKLESSEQVLLSNPGGDAGSAG